MNAERADLALGRDDVHVWLTDYAAIEDARLIDAYRELMAPEEREQETRFVFARDRRRYLVTRALVRSVLSRYADVAPDAWTFGTNAYGCPYARNPEAADSGLTFNLSHTHSLIALAVSRDRAVGVDIENHCEREVSIDIARSYFAPREVSDLAVVPREQQQYRFFEYWTFKESYIKARRMGLSLPLDGFAFHYPTPQGVGLEIAPALSDRADRWHLRQFRPEPDYLLALCAERTGVSAPQLKIRKAVPLAVETELALEVLRASE